MKKLYLILAVLIISTMILTACSTPEPAQPQAVMEEVQTAGVETESVTAAEPTVPVEPVEEVEPTEEVTSTREAAGEQPSVASGEAFEWEQEYIAEVPPIMMIDPYFQIFGQSQGPVPYRYEDVVKQAGHSCGATTGAWTITRKALEALYPDGEIPVRGQIAVEAPGAEDEWYVGVFGEIISYITGAAPKTGFNGAEFGQNGI